MRDQFNREIDYMRISITDRCNLRCRYCMPEARPFIPHGEILRYEEILRICRVAVSLGINKFKITGGEPLVRRGAVDFITELKGTEGVESVTLTTNGALLEEALPALQSAGIDGINISLDALDRETYRKITGRDGVERVLSAVRKSADLGIRTKINTVLLGENGDQILPLAALAGELGVDVRFIELMPIGYGKELTGPDWNDIEPILTEAWPDLAPVGEKRGNGPARYYGSTALRGRIGLIGANSHSFCENCNRVRLTSTGTLKTCLCYIGEVNLGKEIRKGMGNGELRDLMSRQIGAKPAAHCFSHSDKISEQKEMSRIGG